MASGYTNCACRDCPDVTVSSDDTKSELCPECREAGCNVFLRDDWKARVLSTTSNECQRLDAYSC
jgi:hypothetical protein